MNAYNAKGTAQREKLETSPFKPPRKMLSQTSDSLPQIPEEIDMKSDSSGSGEEDLEIDVIDIVRDAMNHWLARNGEAIMRDTIIGWCQSRNTQDAVVTVPYQSLLNKFN